MSNIVKIDDRCTVVREAVDGIQVTNQSMIGDRPGHIEVCIHLRSGHTISYKFRHGRGHDSRDSAKRLALEFKDELVTKIFEV